MKNKSKKKFLHSRRDSGTAETLETPPPPEVCEEPEIDNYPQVETSPYTTRAINLLIGPPATAEQYTIPEYYLQPYPKLHIDSWNNTLVLEDLNPDIGHTLVHYLCSGTYETTKPSPPITSRRLIEFRRSVHVYKAARVYKISGLEQLAKHYIEIFEDHVSLFDILTVIREVKLPEQEVWFVEHLVLRMSAALAADEDSFQSDLLAYGIGRDEKFDPLVLKIVLLLYHGKRYPSDSVRGHGDKGYVVNGNDSPGPVGPDDGEVQESLLYERDEYAVEDAPPEEVPVPLEPEPEPTPPEELVPEEAVPEDPIAEEAIPEEPPIEAPPNPASPPLSPVYQEANDEDVSQWLSPKERRKLKKKKERNHLAAPSEPQLKSEDWLEPEPEPEFPDPPHFELQGGSMRSSNNNGWGATTYTPMNVPDY